MAPGRRRGLKRQPRAWSGIAAEVGGACRPGGSRRPATRRSRSLLGRTELWFLPIENPDGYDYTFTCGAGFRIAGNEMCGATLVTDRWTRCAARTCTRRPTASSARRTTHSPTRRCGSRPSARAQDRARQRRQRRLRRRPGRRRPEPEPPEGVGPGRGGRAATPPAAPTVDRIHCQSRRTSRTTGCCGRSRRGGHQLRLGGELLLYPFGNSPTSTPTTTLVQGDHRHRR